MLCCVDDATPPCTPYKSVAPHQGTIGCKVRTSMCYILFLSVLPPFRRDCTIYDGSTIYDDVACFKECDGGMVGNKPVGTNPNGIVRVTRFPRK